MNEIRVYVEGGGNDKAGKRALREGFDGFLRELKAVAKQRRASLEVVICGGRGATFENLGHARKSHPTAVNIILVDSEGPVTAPTRKQHLTDRDGWDLRGVDESHVHLMAQTMEAWLVADREALATFYGQGFNDNATPKRHDVESIPKDDLEKALENATRNARPKGEYHKIKHGAQLLALVAPAKVRAAAPHCERLFCILSGLLEQPA